MSSIKICGSCCGTGKKEIRLGEGRGFRETLVECKKCNGHGKQLIENYVLISAYDDKVNHHIKDEKIIKILRS